MVAPVGPFTLASDSSQKSSAFGARHTSGPGPVVAASRARELRSESIRPRRRWHCCPNNPPPGRALVGLRARWNRGVKVPDLRAAPGLNAFLRRIELIGVQRDPRTQGSLRLSPASALQARPVHGEGAGSHAFVPATPLGGQWIPEPREAEAREVAIVASSELGHAMMPQSEGQPGVEDDASSDVRLGGQTPQFVHYAGGLPRIVNQHPRRMLAEGLNEGDGVSRVERFVQDGGIAEQDV